MIWLPQWCKSKARKYNQPKKSCYLFIHVKYQKKYYFIFSIQIKYHDGTTSELHGKRVEKKGMKYFTLEPGERIMRITGILARVNRYEMYNFRVPNFLQFHTSNGKRHGPYGSYQGYFDGRTTPDNPTHKPFAVKGHQLVAIRGMEHGTEPYLSQLIFMFNRCWSAIQCDWMEYSPTVRVPGLIWMQL